MARPNIFFTTLYSGNLSDRIETNKGFITIKKWYQKEKRRLEKKGRIVVIQGGLFRVNRVAG